MRCKRDFGAKPLAQVERRGVDRLGRAVVMVAEAIAALCLAARLQAQRRDMKKLERDVVQRARRAAFQLELDLADPRRRGVVTVANAAAVDRRLDPRRRLGR